MIATRFAKIAASGLAIGLSLTGAHSVPTAAAESATDAKAMQVAASAAAKATKAMADRNARAAVAAAETAVQYQPRDPQYRVLLGQAYLSAGRFTSAEAAFSDTLTLSPDNARAALNLALAEIAQGKRDAARSTLTDYADRLSASDYGLALALAGDADGAIRALESAIRDNGGDAKTRQNLALSYAMAGRWANARVMAQQDLAGEAVNDRIGEWAAFVQPASSYDQVASLLGVKAVPDDGGQPTRLALNAVPATALAVVEAPVAVPVLAKPAAVVAPETSVAAFEVTAVKPAPAPAPVKAAAATAIAAPIIHADAAPIKQVVVAASRPMARPAEAVFVKPVAKPTIVATPMPAPKFYRSVVAGKFVVQLGAFQNAAVSRDAWRRLAPRYDLGAFDPANSHIRVGGANYVRLAVGGFATRSEAIGVCTRIRSVGGSCFVRGMINDAPAYWVQRGMPKTAKPVRMASR